MANRSLGTLTLDLVLKMGGFTAGMDKAARDTDRRLGAIESRARKFGVVIGSIISAAYGSISIAIGNAIQNADKLDELSQKLQVSTEQLSKWGYAAKLSGTDLDGLSRGITLLSKNMTDALDPKSSKAGLFEALGISIKDAGGDLRSVESILPEIADAFKKLDNQTLETAISMELFGKSGAELLEFLNRGGDGIDQLGRKLEDLGGVIDSQTAAAAANFNDELDDLRAVTSGYATLVAAELLPAMTDLVGHLKESIKEGGALRETLGLLGDVSRLLVGEFKKSDDVGRSFTQTLQFLGIAASNLRSGLSDLVSFDLKGFVSNMLDAQRAASGAVIAGFQPFETQTSSGAGSGRRGGGPMNLSPSFGAGSAEDVAAYTRRLQKAFQGAADPPKKSSGKSDAQKEADQLKQSYDNLIESLKERTALIGQEGEAAKVSYDLQFGSLKNLTQAEKDRALVAAEKYDADLKAFRTAEDLRREEERGIENATRIREDYEFEIQLLGKTIEEQERLIVARNLGAQAATKQGEDAIKALEDYQKAAKETSEQIAMLDGFRGSFANFFEDVITGTRSVKDAFRDMLADISAQIARRIAENWTEQLFGQMGSTQTGSAGGGWASFFAGLFSSAGGRAGGGAISPFSAYRVNETGMEMASVGGRDYLLTGSRGGYITPNDRVSGRQQIITNNFTVQGRIDRRTESQVAQEIAVRTRVASARNG